MSGPNHITGGIVFTGLYLSFWDINIFEKPSFIVFTVICSLLPDIDHTKSLIGKSIYPLAKWLDKKFGHRTITHSLIFLIGLGFIIGGLERTFLQSGTYTMIFYFAMLSHLILDMITLQGVPLFYPFKKNPCVIPGNPNLRFRSDNVKAEFVMFFVFSALLFTSKDLFTQGFWNTYNKTFGTLSHLYSESKHHTARILVHYEYEENNQIISDTAILANSKPETATLLKPTQIIELNSKNKKLKITPIRKTEPAPILLEKVYTGINLKTLEEITHNKLISEIEIKSNTPISTTQDGFPITSNNITLRKVFNPTFQENIILEDNSTAQKDLELLQIEEMTNRAELEFYQKQKDILAQNIKEAETLASSQNLSEREQGLQLLTQLKREISSLSVPTDKSKIIQLKKKYLLKKSAPIKLSINAKIHFYEIP